MKSARPSAPASTAAGNLSGDGHAVDIVWLRPRAERERRENRGMCYRVTVEPVHMDARLLELRCLGILVEYEAVDLDGDGLGDR